MEQSTSIIQMELTQALTPRNWWNYYDGAAAGNVVTTQLKLYPEQNLLHPKL
jgi:uncharacterized membrane protein YdcZ (DUF606 family)